MTWDNPHPLANPYNTRVYGNFNINKAQSGFYINRNCDLYVPPAKPYDPTIGRNDELHVPNQLPLNSPAVMNTFQNSRFVTLPDGTVMDMVNRKVVQTPNDNDCWGSRTMKRQSEAESQWTDADIYGSPNMFRQNAQQMSDIDVAYQNMCKMQDQKLEQNLSDKQKQIIAKFEKVSKLVEESKRV